jgi:hypothetical protein
MDTGLPLLVTDALPPMQSTATVSVLLELAVRAALPAVQVAVTAADAAAGTRLIAARAPRRATRNRGARPECESRVTIGGR